MSSALIGYTGFVGENIAKQASFDFYFNSKNISELVGRNFDLVVCAGVPAVKWWANQHPKEDLDIINSIVAYYQTIKTKRFILISTVDVYANPNGINELTLINPEDLQPYGRHRLLLEKKILNMYENVNIIRLPALFGYGLKKNILFDLLRNNLIEKINPNSFYQWYPLQNIWFDIQTTINNDLPLVNFAVEPIKTSTICSRFFPELKIGSNALPQMYYDMHSKYSNYFGGTGNYFISANQVLLHMERWLKDPKVKYE